MEGKVIARALPNVTWVSLAEALTWIAFGDSLTADNLSAQVVGNPSRTTHDPDERLRKFFSGEDDDATEVPGINHFENRKSGLDKLSKAWFQMRIEVDQGRIKVRGRPAANYSVYDGRLAETKDLNGHTLATFSQFDVSTGGLRRRPLGSPAVLWKFDPNSFDREVKSFSDDQREADGFLFVEVERAGLMRVFRGARTNAVPANRQLDYDAIRRRASELRAERPAISIGSAAQSIVAEIPCNPKTGKPRDSRHIERMIAPLWEGGIQNPPRKP